MLAPSVWACTYFDAFKNNKDGTVTDPRSNTVWQLCAVGQRWNGTVCAGAGKDVSWWDAMAAAKADRFLGKKDWRVPTLNEAINISGKHDDCVNTKGKARAVSSVFQPVDGRTHLGNDWTTTAYESNRNWVRIVDFNTGYQVDDTYPRDVDRTVRLVRAGQPEALAEFVREYAKIEQYKAAAGLAKENNRSSQNASSQGGGQYTSLYQQPRARADFQNIWQATCQGGGRATVSKRDDQSSVCFYRQGGSTKCESIGVEAAMRKACAE